MKRAGFGIQTEELESGTTLISVRGELDIHTSPVLRREIERQLDRGRRRVGLDLSEVTFLDSLAVSTIVRALEEGRTRRRQIRILEASHRVRLLFAFLRMEHLLPPLPVERRVDHQGRVYALAR